MLTHGALAARFASGPLERSFNFRDESVETFLAGQGVESATISRLRDVLLVMGEQRERRAS